MKNLPLFRIYDKPERYLRLLGTVEASTVEQALEKAVAGKWLAYYATVDKPTSIEGLTARG